VKACDLIRRSRRLLGCSAIVASAFASAAVSTMGAGIGCDANATARGHAAAATDAPVRACAQAAHRAPVTRTPDAPARRPEGAGQPMPVGTNLAEGGEAMGATA
jgi:hypothetical protein